MLLAGRARMTQPAARICACPRCGTSTRLDPGNPWRPFCSERCRLVDFGDWLNERYAIPVADASTADSQDAEDGPPTENR